VVWAGQAHKIMNPLSYDRLDSEWRQWYDTAHCFERKVPAQDRGGIRHNIILELALARDGDGDTTELINTVADDKAIDCRPSAIMGHK